jgi:PAS domain S-box-containing protein
MLDSRYAMWLGWGPDFTFFYNDAYARMTLGPKHPWALGRSAREVWSEIWRDIGPRAESVMQTGQATWDESLLLFLERQGFSEESYHTFSYSPVPDDGGGIGGMLCVVTEDTERTIGERRMRTLRELAARTNDLAKSVEDACRTAARTLATNLADVPFILLYLLSNDERSVKLVGQTGLTPDSPPCPSEVERGRAPWPFDRVAETGRSVIVDDLLPRFGPLTGGAWPEATTHALVLPMAKPGQTRLAGFVVAGLSPRLVFNDAYRGFLDLLTGHIATAIANARAYEDERRRAEALAQLDTAKTAFFSNVSHEFRTPLTLMLGPLEEALAEGEGELPPAQRERLEVAHRNGLRLQRLVNSLLDFSRIEAGRVRATYEPTDAAAFTAELASMFRSACEKAGLRLAVDCPPLPEPVFLDREMWEKVVLNLLSNAFKFTFEGEIAVSLRPVAGAAELRVRDTGTGVPADEMPRLFERFHRVENARGRTHEGSGIGLALVQELGHLHGGSIRAESELGKGTCFTISIPFGSRHLPPAQVGNREADPTGREGARSFVQEAMRWLPNDEEGTGVSGLVAGRESPAPRTLKATLPQGDRPRVLIADDNADMRQYAVRLLADDYAVESVADGQAALAAVRHRTPDLVLSDVMMPRLDGFGLIRELRADPRTAGVPVILLSARAGGESRVEGMRAGADDYLVKPFSAKELQVRVSSLLQIAKLRRESERAIRQSEERFRVLFETMSEGFAIDEVLFDEAGRARDVRYLEVNPAFERHTGLKRSDILGRTTRELFPDAEPVWFERYGHVVTTGIPAHFQERFGPLGRWFEVSAYRTGAGLLACVFFDITDQKRAEEATQRQAAQLRKLAEVATRLNAANDVASITGVVTEEARTLIGSHQAVTTFMVDLNWAQAVNTVTLSEKYAEWRGYDGKPDGSGISALVCQTNTSFRMSQAELQNHPTYERFGPPEHHPPMRGWLAAPLVGRDGRNMGLIQLSDRCEDEFTEEDEAILVQLAQMVSVALENARLMEDLREADRRKDEFLATLAHELRNPLAPLRNGLQVMKLSRNDSKAAEVSRDMMERQLSQMVRLIDDLLDVSRISRGKIQLQKQQIPIATVVQQAIETSRPLIDAFGHELIVHVPGETINVDADMTRLAQVFANLLNNAAKYTDRGGRITLRIDRQGNEVVVSVRDTGVGIPPRMLPQLFEMFVQVDRSLERSQGGLGIGLSLVKRLVELHGGTVKALSAGPGRGSEFIVRLPVLHAVTPVETSPATNGNSAGHTRRRILVVDDNRDSAASLAMMLDLLGNETRTAHDGEEALSAAAAFRPDMILLDIGMPKLNGYEAARRIRTEPWGKAVVLVALTGWGQDEDRRRSAEAGFNFHLVKPVDPEELGKLLSTKHIILG